jgi:hypothetical protein
MSIARYDIYLLHHNYSVVCCHWCQIKCHASLIFVVFLLLFFSFLLFTITHISTLTLTNPTIIYFKLVNPYPLSHHSEHCTYVRAPYPRWIIRALNCPLVLRNRWPKFLLNWEMVRLPSILPRHSMNYGNVCFHLLLCVCFNFCICVFAYYMTSN